ncbi:MAG: chorismate mutase [Clostridia bacterium]|nr:chorismate mutase [Clostridia bacterium]
MDLNELRREIDRIDGEMIRLFGERMKVAQKIAGYKKERGLPVLDPVREREKLDAIAAANPELCPYITELYGRVFEISRAYQQSVIGEGEAGGFGLLGGSLSHSHSPLIHSMLGDYSYELFERDPDGAREFILSGDWSGLNVTIPYKKLAFTLCGEVSDTAEKCGSVNTLIRRNGKIYGDNTDYFGFLATVRESGVGIGGKKCLVLGSGGAAGAVRAVLSDLGAGEIVTVSRGGEDNYENITRHADADIIVNATPVGMYPENGARPVDISLFPRLSGVFDLIFNPLKTKLILDAEKRGVPSRGGLLMLVAQAKKSSDLFLGRTSDDAIIREIAAELEKRVRNVVLVGMPGCGKTTVGKIVAERLGRPFVDTDSEIERAAGEPIKDIFAKYGEEYFRTLEEKAVGDAGKLAGAVVSVGGGAVMREANRDALRQNGVVVYLMRDTGSLPREGRPLSEGADLSRMRREREPYYKAVADAEIENDDPGHAADGIIEVIRR